MGAKDSKPSFISYEDAVKRVSDSELRRIREAFKRCAGANGTSLSLEAFVREVLSDGVPYEVADWLYQACGGTKRGIAFKELLCGIVVLTKGNLEEKIKFLWTLYVNNQGDNGTYIYKWDFASALHMENISLPFTGAHRSAEILTSLFGPNDKVTFEQFRSWLLIHKDATVLSKWLLSGNANAVQELDTPTFYQSLAGVTHLEERDIIELEKCFWSLRNSAPTGQLDAESLAPLLAHPLPKAAVAGVFLAFDENRDGHVDFKELCCGLSAACRGPRTERLKLCFKIFDLDRDGVLNKKELIDMADILCTVANEHLKNQSSRASTPSEDDGDKGFDPEVVLLNLRDKLVTNVPKNGKKPVFQLGPGDEVDAVKQDKSQKIDTMDLIALDTALTQEDFLIWAVESADSLVAPFLQLLFEVCHIVLGLRPHCKHQERDIVLGWLRRSVQRGYSVGQFWYLIASEWWGAWAAYTAGDGVCCRARPDDIVCDESFTTTSTESMGSLLWRAETASLGSASSGVGSAGARPRAPGAIDNRRLLAPNPLKVRTLTGEGGHLRRDVTLAQHRDFELVPDALWRALALWYGGAEPLPRQVIRPPNSDVELELYPLNLKILRHVAVPQRMNSVSAVGGVSMYSSMPVAPPAPPAAPERQLAYTAAFSRLATVKQVSEFLCQALGLQREDVRLWSFGTNAVLLDDENWTLAELRCDERTRLLLEVRNADLTWPEEIGALSMSNGNRAMERRETLIPPNLPGATGLHNLGNTCYMNAALQSPLNAVVSLRCRDETDNAFFTDKLMSMVERKLRQRNDKLYTKMSIDVPTTAQTILQPYHPTMFTIRAIITYEVWNTGPLTRYFNSGMHLYEVNTTNPLGTKGALAVRYGELCKEVWSCSARSVAPLRVRWCVSRHARALAGGGQHDAQELLAWLLDTLHEDLNRAAARPPPIRDSDGRPDQEVAAEAWAAYAARNASIVTDLFYGQLKSRVRCDVCSAESTRFDAFNMLSLPLPVEQSLRAQVIVMLLDGSVPIKYGVLVNSEGTYLDLKKKLSELCGLAPESMTIVELNGATIGRVLDDNAKISAATALELYAYETPREATHDECVCDHQQEWTGPEGEGAARAEVSARAPNTSSLCMPALFCFKRSKSEILMSQSPPNTFYKYADNQDYRTLPKVRDRNGNSSPTLSVKSLNLKPSSPRLGKVKFGSSPSNMNKMNETQDSPVVGRIQYLVAVHRKQTRMDAYFLPAQRSKPALFGVPLLVGVAHGMSGRAVYAQVWAQVARLLSARPKGDASNHATDCDDSLGYEFPFTLRLVSGSGAWCALCPWPALCRGCALPSDDAPLCTYGNSACPQRCAQQPPIDADTPDSSSPIARAKLRQNNARAGEDQESCHGSLTRLDFSVLRQLRGRRGAQLAIDWDPTALHLRYQSTREKAWVIHPSVAESAAAAARPVDLASCLRAFTSHERLEQRYHCARCRAAQPATKVLQIWRLPPILIIHLKRFQYVNNKWIKSQKVVNFPFQEFDPSPYLASVPQETIARHMEINNIFRRRSSMFVDVEDAISESESESECEVEEAEPATPTAKSPTKEPPKLRVKITKRRESCEVRRRERLESTSLLATPVTDDNLVDFHRHLLTEGQDPFNLKYRLYAVVSHSGQMSGGHYVAYARNPTGTWLCYNDSMCRELGARPPIDPASAYLLFYERQGLDYERYLPDIKGKEPVIKDSETLDPDESDLRKMCVIA